MFVVMASEIVTLNLNYVDPESLKKKPSLVTQANAGRARSGKGFGGPLGLTNSISKSAGLIELLGRPVLEGNDQVKLGMTRQM
jgi:hypothetical protein